MSCEAWTMECTLSSAVPNTVTFDPITSLGSICSATLAGSLLDTSLMHGRKTRSAAHVKAVVVAALYDASSRLSHQRTRSL